MQVMLPVNVNLFLIGLDGSGNLGVDLPLNLLQVRTAAPPVCPSASDARAVRPRAGLDSQSGVRGPAYHRAGQRAPAAGWATVHARVCRARWADGVRLAQRC